MVARTAVCALTCAFFCAFLGQSPLRAENGSSVAFVGDVQGSAVSYFDVTNPLPEKAQSVGVGAGPIALAVADNRYVCVYNAASGTVSILDAYRPTRPATTVTVGVLSTYTSLPFFFNAPNIAIAANTIVCVPNLEENTVSVFDVTKPPSGKAPTIDVGFATKILLHVANDTRRNLRTFVQDADFEN